MEPKVLRLVTILLPLLTLWTLFCRHWQSSRQNRLQKAVDSSQNILTNNNCPMLKSVLCQIFLLKSHLIIVVIILLCWNKIHFENYKQNNEGFPHIFPGSDCTKTVMLYHVFTSVFNCTFHFIWEFHWIVRRYYTMSLSYTDNWEIKPS